MYWRVFVQIATARIHRPSPQIGTLTTRRKVELRYRLACMRRYALRDEALGTAHAGQQPSSRHAVGSRDRSLLRRTASIRKEMARMYTYQVISHETSAMRHQCTPKDKQATNIAAAPRTPTHSASNSPAQTHRRIHASYLRRPLAWKKKQTHKPLTAKQRKSVGDLL
ncbi:uncharacterized protein M421DRAFT_419406 [Didymella exigua CBS 183.55]|uniref:Uncharacterized protein n=1 Tax=Didymella exigua CBS 183.55 TaxID=1150837 RepID=A0A6A5RR17_9PLEO|nr:uncharacterized protein M421DRAFT_419406 [Didymella exigua CBS 183.55]KAF1929618.1 hypothetical protein M421DRAFT_419406 [Didymella exigua CBS 183.55]